MHTAFNFQAYTLNKRVYLCTETQVRGICGGIIDSSFEVEIIQVFINSIRVFLGKNNNTNAVINQEKNLNTEKWFYFFLFHSKA